MSKHPWECVLICNSVYKSERLDAVNSSGRAPHEFESCSMSAHKSSGKQSHPVILLRVPLLSLKTNQIHLCSHTCRSFAFLSSHRMFLLFHLYGFLSLLLFSSGHQESSSLQPCSIGGGSCPAMCTCSNNIVDCRGKGLTAIPANLPDSMAEM